MFLLTCYKLSLYTVVILRKSGHTRRGEAGRLQAGGGPTCSWISIIMIIMFTMFVSCMCIMIISIVKTFPLREPPGRGGGGPDVSRAAGNAPSERRL